MAMAQVRARFADRSIPGSGVTEAILALGALLVGGATALVIVREPRWAGGLAAGAGVLLAVAGFRVVRDRAPLDEFFDSMTDRAFDGCLLSAIALVLRGTDLVTAAIAVAALVASFIAAYERARGRALGYPIEDSVVTRSLRYGLVSLGLLLPGWLRGTLIAVLALAVLSCAVRASQVAKQERE